MSLTLELSPAEMSRIERIAQNAGVSVDDYARRCLLSHESEILNPSSVKQPWSLERFIESLPPAPSRAEVEAHIADVEAMRNEWEEREVALNDANGIHS